MVSRVFSSTNSFRSPSPAAGALELPSRVRRVILFRTATSIDDSRSQLILRRASPPVTRTVEPRAKSAKMAARPGNADLLRHDLIAQTQLGQIRDILRREEAGK